MSLSKLFHYVIVENQVYAFVVQQDLGGIMMSFFF